MEETGWETRSGRPETAADETRGEVSPVPVRPTPPGKRAADIALSVTGRLLTAPAWVILPLVIKLEDGGPVFFRQERVGKGGERFTSFKFRSMRPAAGREGPPAQAAREAERVTRVGQAIRPFALDELPQLWNVLRGEMSLVGPRPLLPEEVQNHSDDEAVRLAELPGYEERHAVLPGLTGLAQTRAARDLPHRKKFYYDRRYVRRRSLWLDLKLIARSVVISLLGAWPEIGGEERGEA